MTIILTMLCFIGSVLGLVGMIGFLSEGNCKLAIVCFVVAFLSISYPFTAFRIAPPHTWRTERIVDINAVTIDGRAIQEAVYRDTAGNVHSVNLTSLLNEIIPAGKKVLIKLDGTSYSIGWTFTQELEVKIQ